jgi:hypothetical protein
MLCLPARDEISEQRERERERLLREYNMKSIIHSSTGWMENEDGITTHQGDRCRMVWREIYSSKRDRSILSV